MLKISSTKTRLCENNKYALRIFTIFGIIMLMKKLTVNKQTEEKLRKGILVLDKNDFPTLSFTDQCVELHSQQGKFLGTAYLSLQNKVLGWLISNAKV